MPQGSDDRRIEERLLELEAESDRRRRQLTALIADVPEAVSRRAVVVEMVRDLRRVRVATLLGRAAQLLRRRTGGS